MWLWDRVTSWRRGRNIVTRGKQPAPRMMSGLGDIGKTWKNIEKWAGIMFTATSIEVTISEPCSDDGPFHG
jgi:hypothetical protein